MKPVRHPRAPELRRLAGQWLAEVRTQVRCAPDPAGWFYSYFLERFCRYSAQAELYPTLLSWKVQLSDDCTAVEWVQTAGHERKRLGSYYTPDCLIECLLQTALDPLLDEAKTVADLLALTICDPACGSGRLLLPAGERLVGRLIACGLDSATARRQVAEQCLFGMDSDPIAVELCRRALRAFSWGRFPTCHSCNNGRLETCPTEEHRIRHGNSLLAEWPHRFAVVHANPPWGRVKVEYREWGAHRTAFAQARHDALDLAHTLRTCGRFPLSARGDLNVYPLFVELARDLLADGGRAGIIVPSGLATQIATQPLFADLLDKQQLVSWFDFTNRRRLFPDVEGNVKFALLTLTQRPQRTFRVAAQLEHPDERVQPERSYDLDAAQLARLNPETRHLPAAKTGRMLRRLLEFADRFSPLSESWPVSFGTMFHMTADARHLRRDDERIAGTDYWPLYEAKLVQQYNHRHATFAGVPAHRRYGLHAAPLALAGSDQPFAPRYWVEAETAAARGGKRSWFLVLRNAIAATADARSVVATLLPGPCAVGNSLVIAEVNDLRAAHLLLALFNSLIVDFIVKQKASGSNLNFHILRQIPLPRRADFDAPSPWQRAQSLADWVTLRVCELSNLEGEFDNNEERRFRLRCEIDAAVFHLYAQCDVAEILQSFPILERREQRDHGRQRTRAALGELLAAL